MPDNFSVVIKLSKPKEGEKFFRVFSVESIKSLHKDLAKTLNLSQEMIPSYLDTYNLCNQYGIKIHKEDFHNLSDSLLQTWYNFKESYEYQECTIRNE
jgi:transcription termination factor Rho